MLNFEKYKSLLDRINLNLAVMDGKPCKCNEIDCQDCDFDLSEDCEKSAKMWLFEEYKEDWTEVEVDTPILVSDSIEPEWTKRYFAKFEGGLIYTWNNGRTSWSTESSEDITPWKYAKIVEINREEQEDE